MKTRIIVFAVISVLASCKQGKTKKLDIKTSSNSIDSIKRIAYTDEEISQLDLYKLIDTALDYGDRKVYHRVSHYYLMNGMHEAFLFPALIMANRYKDPAAYFDVYDILCNMRYDSHLERVDSASRSLALYYLLKSYELGNDDAKYELKEIYVNKKLPIPKSSDFIQFKQ